MIDTTALRKKVLDLAIKGKLSQQDANDEPASVLVEKNHKEKAKLFEKGKLKKKEWENNTVIFKGDDNLYYEKYNNGTVKCIENEIPFRIPDGWQWERLGNVVGIARGGSPRPIKNYLTSEPDGVNWIKIGDTKKNEKYIWSTKEKIIKEGVVKSRYVKKGDFLLTNSMSFGRPYILKIDGCIHDGWLVLEKIENVFNQDYLFYALSSDFMYKSLESKAVGVAVNNLKIEVVKSVLFPIPPLGEQKRIASLIESIINYLETIDYAQDELEKDNYLLNSKILDLAVRGNLVLQDSSDEPANELLNKIREERRELFEEGKLKKKDLINDSVIYEDDGLYYEKYPDGTVNCIESEIPFSIPKGWSWCRLQTIADVFGRIGYRGYTKKDLTTKGKGAITLSPSNIVDSEMDYSSCSYISWEKYEESPEIMIEEGDILFVKTASIGKTAIVKNLPEKATINPQFVVLKNRRINTEYLCLYLKSKVALKKYNKLVAGNAVPTISQEKLNAMYVPVPPLDEQKRIVDKINRIMNYCKIIQ